MDPLENPPSNPCFGCGPGHDRGLRLSFARGEDGDGPFVAATHTPAEDEVGWPGLLHGGLHFTLLYEASYWAALTLGPALMTARGDLTFEEHVVPRVGRPLEVRGRIAGVEPTGEAGEGREERPVVEGGGPDRHRIRAATRGGDGRLLGTLAGTWAPADREAVEAAGIDLPDYLDEDLAP